MNPDNPIEQIRAALPDAHIVETADGPISRPDLIAAVIREASARIDR